MSRRSPRKWSYYVEKVPKKLSPEARKVWPDLHEWPTPASVKTLRHLVRGKPALRLEVLNGLRLFSVVDVQPIWNFAALWFAVLVALLAPAVGTSTEGLGPWLGAISAIMLVAFGVWVLIYVPTRTLAMAERTAQARLWLEALQDRIQ